MALLQTIPAMPVQDAAAAVVFYRDRLGFEVVEQIGAVFARVARDDLTLWLAGPSTSAARPMPDGARPEPGGWNRIVIEVTDIESEVDRLTGAGISFRNAIISGPPWNRDVRRSGAPDTPTARPRA